jgi:hypothetical protein
MARRPRRSERVAAPTTDYADPEGNVLVLRGSLTPGTRRRYAETLAGAGSPAATRDDAGARAMELLFEHLAVRWVIHGLPIERQRELLGRLRMASGAEREWVRKTLRAHCEANFPDVEAP